LRMHRDERRYKCDNCKKSFATRGRLTEHMRIHTGERPFKCEFCEKTFVQSASLTVHRRIHTGEMPYKCEKCDKAFRSSSDLCSHRARKKCIYKQEVQTEPEDLRVRKDSPESKDQDGGSKSNASVVVTKCK
jgi:uncharacterized Zn-finger protein